MDQLDELTDGIHAWLMETFPLAKEREIGIHDSLLDSGIIDSLGTLEVVTYLEQELGVEVTDDEMVADTFNSVHAIAQFVAAKQQRQTDDAKAN